MNINETMVNQGASLPPGRTRKKANGSVDSSSESPKSSSNVKVVVRVRPTNTIESQGNHTNVVRAMDDRMIVFDPHEDIDTNSFIPNKKASRRGNIMNRRAKDLRFIFDRVFDERSSNQDIFNHTTKTIIDGVLNGYNCTVFAYGATGAGKTHTMLGNGVQMPGVMFLTMMDLYNRIGEMENEKTCEVAVSYLEVYNETIRDLLMPGKPLAVREDPHKGVCVTGLTLHQPRSAEELFGMLEFGNRNRSQHPTDANATSSRSHAVFQVFVRQKSKTCGLKADIQCAKMSLIDLAGSERATATKNRGARFREGANINKSLLALGNCINALAENQGGNLHIPYRNSKLTRILKDSLGGNCRTVMIAAVSPSSLSYEDTYNTLKYADRAKSIKSDLIKNVISVDLHVSRYAKLVKELQSEVVVLKEKLNRFESGEATPLRRNVALSRKNDETEKLKTEIKTIYCERSNIKKNLVDTECLEKQIMEKLYRKQRNAEWIGLLCHEDNKTDKVETRVRKCLSATKSRLKHLHERKEKLNKQLKQNDEWLKRTQDEIKMFENNGDNGSCKTQSSLCTDYDASCSHELRSTELKQECKYYKKCLQNYETQRKREKRLIDGLLRFVKKQFVVMKSSGMTTNEMTEDYDNIVNIIEDNREVAWADQTMQSGEETKEFDITKMNNFSLVDSSQTPNRTPLKPKLSNFVSDFTPKRVKTPTLTLSSTLPSRKMSISPFIPAQPSPRTITTQSNVDNKTPPQTSVRQNLLGVLNQNASTSAVISCDLSSTYSDGRTLLETPSFPCTTTKMLGLAENDELRKYASFSAAGTNLQTDSGVMSSKPVPFSKRPYSKQTAIRNRSAVPPLQEKSKSLNIQPSNHNQMSTAPPGILRQKTNTSFLVNKSVCHPLREHSDSLNIQSTIKEQTSAEPGVLRQRTNILLGGNENVKKIPSYASLTKSAAQKITSRDMLPKRSHPKENNQPEPKRSKPPRSVSSSSLLNNNSLKRQQHHISGLKRAVSVIHMRK